LDLRRKEEDFLTVPLPSQGLSRCYEVTPFGSVTRAIQHYLGHRNIQHTTRYTELAADRFKDFWRD